MTLSTILKEMKNIPAHRLDDLYAYVHSLTTKTNKSESLRKKILSFAGSFKDMSEKNYQEFVKETKKTRVNLFERNT